MTEIAPCPRCGYGAGPQGAERYWEARWRDEKAHNDEMMKALRGIIQTYENPDDIEPEENMIEIARDALRTVVGQ